jgi:hypothetical protein
MKISEVQEQLRKILWERIRGGRLTGMRLAAATGFEQAHISNFLNRKRSLSFEGFDRMLKSQNLSVLDLLDPAEVSKRATISAPSPDAFEDIVLVEGRVAAGQPLISSQDVRDTLKFKKTFLKRLRTNMASSREAWRRFVLVKIDSRDGAAMYPRLLPGSTALIDRHYNSLDPYRRSEPNMYAVRRDDGCTVRYVELAGENLVLRPHDQAHPIDVVALERGQGFAEHIVGRICHVGNET